MAASSSANAPAALQALRAATVASHAGLEARLGLEDADEIGLVRYVQLLAGLHRFLGAWEPLLASALPARLRPWFAARSRRHLAQRDLESIGAEAALRPLPAATPLPITLDSLAAVFGSLYVVEGSALGGQRITRRAHALWGFDAQRGATYFHGWGADTGGRWRAFCDLLEAEIGPTPAARAAACAAAVQTFDALAGHFEDLPCDERAA